MEKEYSHIDELLAGYFSGNLAADGAAEVRDWSSASPENMRYLLSMREIWFSSLAADTSRYDSDEACRKFLAGKTKTNRTAKRTVWQIAAAVATLFIISYISFRQGSLHFEKALAEIVIEAPWGSKTRTFLPDGTLVWLNAGTKITYSQGFGIKERNVRLDGEGYFEVMRNGRLPFNVATDEMTVRVLGTKFNFRNYSDDDEAIVSLVEGRVLVNNNIKRGEKATIVRNRRALINKKTGRMSVSEINAKNTSEWTHGYLFFDEELLSDIVKKLERSYDVNITMETPEMKQLRFYGNFIRKEQSINDVLDALESTGRLKYKKHGKEIVLSQ
ncbi:MAG: DUF4974 domain-containing protein [Tannerella sp.]|jgi:ferric-dicitrate binding protein FerR (iron transport regulator)|nr:DUF4974 domain-containing protein [Tannerella sp.]